MGGSRFQGFEITSEEPLNPFCIWVGQGIQGFKGVGLGECALNQNSSNPDKTLIFLNPKP